MSKVRISDRQLASLVAAGICDVSEFDSDELIKVRAAVDGVTIAASEEVAQALTELANEACEIGHDKTTEKLAASMYRTDSRVLTALAARVRKEARANV